MASNFDTLSDNAKRFIAIAKKDGSDVEFHTIITSVDQSGGAKGFESIATQSGGRLKNFRPQEDIELTLEGYAVEVGTKTGTTGNGFEDLLDDSLSASAGTDPLSVTGTHDRPEYRLILVKTADWTRTTAIAASNSAEKAVRWTYKNGHITNVVHSDTDNVVKFTITYKVAPYAKDGTSNITKESADGTRLLKAVAAYT